MEDNDFGYAFVGFLLGAILTGLLAGCIANDLWEKDSIKHGVARYHPETGAWEWTVELPPKKAEKEPK